jgi:hypothetical protein
MELDRYVDDLQRRLAEAASLAGEEAEHLAHRLAGTLESAVRLAMLDALSAAVGEISTELAPGSVDVRVRGGEPEFVVVLPDPAVRGGDTMTTPSGSAPVSAPPAATFDEADQPGETTRTTLRLPDHLKDQAEAAAARDGVSLNTWLVRAVSAALAAPAPALGAGSATHTIGTSGGARVTGWVR